MFTNYLKKDFFQILFIKNIPIFFFFFQIPFQTQFLLKIFFLATFVYEIVSKLRKLILQLYLQK